MSTVIDIDHEAGDLSEYDSTATDSGDLSAHADAALAGSSYGLKVTIDDTNALYGQANFSPTKSRLRLRLYFDPNSLTMSSGDSFHFIRASQSNGNAYRWSIEFGYDGSDYRLRPWVYDSTSGVQTGSWVTITDAVHWLEVDWKEDSGGSNDGFIKLWVDDISGAADASVENVDNELSIGEVRFGAPTGLDASTSGTFYMDEIEANDDGTEIGAIASSSIAILRRRRENY